MSNSSIARSLALRNDFHEFAFDVKYGVHNSGDPCRDSRICDVLVCALSEIDRQRGYTPHDLAKHLLKITVAYLMALRLDTTNTSDLVAYIHTGNDVAKLPEFWRRSARLLSEAICVLRRGVAEMHDRGLDWPDLSNLPSLLQSSFTGLGAEGAHLTAEAIHDDNAAGVKSVTPHIWDPARTFAAINLAWVTAPSTFAAASQSVTTTTAMCATRIAMTTMPMSVKRRNGNLSRLQRLLMLSAVTVTNAVRTVPRAVTASAEQSIPASAKGLSPIPGSHRRTPSQRCTDRSLLDGSDPMTSWAVRATAHESST